MLNQEFGTPVDASWRSLIQNSAGGMKFLKKVGKCMDFTHEIGTARPAKS